MYLVNLGLYANLFSALIWNQWLIFYSDNVTLILSFLVLTNNTKYIIQNLLDFY